MTTKSKVHDKWAQIVEAKSMPPVANQSRKEIVAAILENQEQDIAANTEGVYTDSYIVSQLKHLNGGHLSEAVVTGDHGYDATKIAQGANSGAAVGVGPTVMGLVRRAIPNMIAFDICGVQPMDRSTGQVFAVRAMYGKDFGKAGDSSREAFHPVAGTDASWSGAQGTVDNGGTLTKYTAVGTSASTAGKVYTHQYVDGKKIYVQAKDTGLKFTNGTAAAKDAAMNKFLRDGTGTEISEGMATSYAELAQGFNDSAAGEWNEMSFRIDKQTVEAKSRQLKAQYSIELAQDLKAVHGLSADSELSSILATEMMLEINREVLLWINATAQVGKTGWTNMHGGQAGVFNFDNPADVRGARWAGEAYKALIIQIDKEANEIARQTGRGAGNFIIASRNLVAALAHTDMMVSVASQGTITGMNTDTNKSVFAGILAGKYRVYIDQYAKEDYFTVGYKGASNLDAGIYYCPYVALTPLRGADPKNFQPVMGFKTRYAIGINPMADSSKVSGFTQLNNGMPTKEMFGKNCYFRRVYVTGL